MAVLRRDSSRDDVDFARRLARGSWLLSRGDDDLDPDPDEVDEEEEIPAPMDEELPP